MTYTLIPTGSAASLASLDAALDYANEFVAGGFASSYEISETVGPVYGGTRFSVTFFRSVATA